MTEIHDSATCKLEANGEACEMCARASKSPSLTYYGHPRLDTGLDYGNRAESPSEASEGYQEPDRRVKIAPTHRYGSNSAPPATTATIRAALFDVLDWNTRELYAHDCEHHRVTDEEASENRYLLADMLIRRIGEIQRLEAQEGK